MHQYKCSTVTHKTLYDYLKLLIGY